MGSPAASVQLHQRQQAVGFGLLRRDQSEHAAHAQRVVAELRPQPFVAPRRRVAFVEDEVDDLQHRSQPLRKRRTPRGLIGQASLRQRTLGAHDALGNGRFRQQEGARDLFRRQAADHPKRQRGAGLARQSRMASGEDQAQQLVADIVVQRGIRIGHRLLLLLQVAYQHLVLAIEHAAAAQLIQRASFGCRHQPSRGLFRHAGCGPMFERRH